MSYLAAALQSALDQEGISQTQFAKDCGITQGQVNRGARGTVNVGYDTVDAMARALPDHHAAAILVGWLRDQLSPDLAHHVLIEAARMSVREATPERPLPDELDSETRRRILWLADQAVIHTAVRDALRSLEAAANVVFDQ